MQYSTAKRSTTSGKVKVPDIKPSGVGSSSGSLGSFYLFRTAVERKQQAEAQAQALQEQLFAKTKLRSEINQSDKPSFYERPAFNTPEYWRDSCRGWISEDEQRNDHADLETRRRRALDSKQNKARPPERHSRSAPRSTKQFAKAMSTEAARDDRLTPQSKALLQVIVARTGKGHSTDTTKTTLGIILNRCPRSVQRYVQELIKFGYIRTQTIKSRRTGFFVGIRIWIMNSVLPFFAKKTDAYNPEEWLDLARNRRDSEETKESLTNNKDILRSVLSPNKPPWLSNLAYR